ncbi:MAG: DUF4124 domain-containing protein [Gammaproteobacteria bacterium]|nr:DUF4124 domain-containing protein [Gammaproteobacteria bacterium]
MKTWIALSLAFLSTAGSAPKTPVATPAAPVETVVVHRCTDAKGRITLQDEPCPKGSQSESREMTRPKDPPKSRPVPVLAPPIDALPDEPAPFARRELIPPPPMYRCTSYDGIERFSESYDPNPRCEPMVIYYPYPNNLTPAQALSCRWVEDSCVRLSDSAACARWKVMRKDAVSAVARSFSDTAAYRKSELERLTQITEESCP